MNTKICRNCGERLTLDNFSINKSNKDGLNNACKRCACEYAKKYRKENREIIIQKSRQRYAQHKDEYSQKGKEYYLKNKDLIKQRVSEYRNNNKEYYSAFNKEYREKNKEQLRESKKEYHYKRLETDEIYLFKNRARTKIYQYFYRKGFKKPNHTEDILGCSLLEFKAHLYKTFFDNYGYEYDGIEKVHIDHIIPLATAKTVEEVEKLCHYTNLQLLKPKDNIRKGAKLIYQKNA